MNKTLNQLDEVSRRGFATYAAKAFLGVGLLPVAGATALGKESKSSKKKQGTAKNVIYLYMSGGMTHMDTLDPKPGVEN